VSHCDIFIILITVSVIAFDAILSSSVCWYGRNNLITSLGRCCSELSSNEFVKAEGEVSRHEDYRVLGFLKTAPIIIDIFNNIVCGLEVIGQPRLLSGPHGH
jgi:hypothetical protein